MPLESGAAANHLAGQASPYLVAHAHDLVDWHAWGEEAFAVARDRELPIFLSVGYQSCHWCHVMQRESFRDEATAAYLNENFVSVKVDRELRPDVDHLYMTYVQAATGRGGWPMTVFLTPDLAPFMGGTYFPREAPIPQMATFMDVLETVSKAWKGERAAVEATGAKALEVLHHYQQPRLLAPVDRGFVDVVLRRIHALEDSEWGGLKGAPKFPQLPVVELLVAHHIATGDQASLAMALRWVYGLLRGGTFDQLGGGLFRYSTDERWLVPHFEKMLYDSAQLLSVLASIHRIAPSDELAHAARATAEFLERDLARPGGGFYSSLDAETQGIEGGTYLWSIEQLAEVLTEDELDLARRRLGVTDEGHLPHGNSITRRDGLAEDAVLVNRVLVKLHEARKARPQPSVIENTLTEWNALAARGLLEAGRWFADERMLEKGTRTLEWLLEALVDGPDVVHAADDPSVAGVRLLDDYASVIAACLAVPKRVADPEIRRAAELLFESAEERFCKNGLAYSVAADTDLPIRPIRWEDSATPSGVSLLAEQSRLLGRERSRIAEALMKHLRIAGEAGPLMVASGLKEALART